MSFLVPRLQTRGRRLRSTGQRVGRLRSGRGREGPSRWWVERPKRTLWSERWDTDVRVTPDKTNSLCKRRLPHSSTTSIFINELNHYVHSYTE